MLVLTYPGTGRAEEVGLGDLNAGEALEWVGEEDTDDESDVDEVHHEAFTRDAQHNQLVHAVAVPEAKHNTNTLARFYRIQDRAKS